MIIYKRPIEKKLVSLRLLLVLFLVALAGTFHLELLNLFYFLATVFIFLSFIVVKDLAVSADYLTLRNYYVFGLIPIKWNFDISEEVVIRSDNSKYGSDLDVPGTDNSDTGLGILLGCVFPIIAKPKTGLISHSFQKVKSNGKLTTKVNIFLTEHECRLTELFGHHKHGI